MRKLAIVTAAAAFALGAHANANTFSLTASSDEEKTTAQTERTGFFWFIANATSDAFGVLDRISGREKDEIVLRMKKDSESCPDSEAAETEAEEVEEKAPMGPEPMYFGFQSQKIHILIEYPLRVSLGASDTVQPKLHLSIAGKSAGALRDQADEAQGSDTSRAAPFAYVVSLPPFLRPPAMFAQHQNLLTPKLRQNNAV